MPDAARSRPVERNRPAAVAAAAQSRDLPRRPLSCFPLATADRTRSIASTKPLMQPSHYESAARAGGRAEAVVPPPGRARLDGRSRQRGRRCSQRSTAPVMPMHDRFDGDRQLTFAFVLGGGLRSWRAIGPTRPRVVGVAQSRRRQHSQRWAGRAGLPLRWGAPARRRSQRSSAPRPKRGHGPRGWWVSLG